MGYREVSRADLDLLVRYDPNTGQFLRLGWFRSGKYLPYAEPRPASGVNQSGYVQLVIRRQHFFGHRLAWFLTYGEWPDVIDHINGDKSDNRIINLRSLSQGENLQNLRAPKSHNTTGYLGVSFEAERGKYVAAVGLGGKRLVVGRFDTAEEAHAAYLKRKRELHCASTL